MDTNNERTSPFTDINGMVAVILEDVAERPVPRGAKTRLAEIRQAVVKGIATVEMAVDIIRLYPKDRTA